MALRPFEDLVVEHGPAVMRVCRALLPPTDAEDAWAETFLSALRAYPDLRPGSNEAGWLVTIAHHKAIDSLRATKRRPVPSPFLPERASDRDPGRLDEEVREALVALPPKQRGAIVYRYLADLSYAEIGDLLDSSEAAARRSAADGIANLRTVLREGAES